MPPAAAAAAAATQAPPLPAPGPRPPAGGAPAGGAGFLVTVAAIGLAVAALYFGRDILIPIALSVLLSFVLGPLATRLRRLGLPRVPAVLAVVAMAFLAIGAFGVVVGGQLAQLAQNLPSYQENIRGKLRSLRDAGAEGGVVERTTTMLEELSRELQESEPRPPGSGAVEAAGGGGQERRVTVEGPRPAGGAGAQGPVTVRIEEPPPGPLEVIRDVALPLLAPVGTAGLVIVFVVFILLEREDLRDRLIRLVGGVGGGDLHQTTEALNETAKRVSRYLLMQLVVNATYGIPIGVGLWLIGVPNALLWGLLATVLRFVPYVGPFVAALFPLALAVAVDPGWTMLAWTAALFLGLELFSNNVVEPWLYGASTGISTVAILVAAVFWTTLWGPVGLLLSTPLTVCLAVVGRYVPQLAFLDVMLGSEPVLDPPERLYQRMLAGDPDEGQEIAEEYLEDGGTLAGFYDEVALPALRLAEADRRRRVLTGERRALCVNGFVAVAAELADHEDPPPAAADAGEPADGDAPPAAAVPPAWAARGAVLCVAGRTGLDRAAAEMLAQLLGRRGIGARALPADAVGPEGVAGLDLAGVKAVCLCYLGPAAVVHGRQVARRLRRAAPAGTRMLVAAWNGQIDEARAGGPAAAAAAVGADLVAATLGQAVERVAALAEADAAAEAEAAPPAPPAASPVPANEAERLAALRATGLLEGAGAPDGALDRITLKVARAFGVPVSLVTLVDDARQVVRSRAGPPGGPAAAPEAPREDSVCAHVVAADEVVVVEDAERDARFAGNAGIRERGIRFYAGAPLRTREGLAIGALCVIDTEPRTVTHRERALLQALADEVAAEVERRRPAAAPGAAPAGPPAAAA